MSVTISSWGETHEGLLKLWRVYWQIKDGDEAMAERFKQEVILPIALTISDGVAEAVRLQKEIEKLLKKKLNE